MNSDAQLPGRKRGPRQEEAVNSYIPGTGNSEKLRGGRQIDGNNNELADLEASVPGVPGVDFPILSQVPETSFSCDDQLVEGKVFIYYN